MMKTRNTLLLLASLWILVIGSFIIFAQDRNPLQTFAASAHRDCAPWDGAAFTVNIPLEDGTMIDISIWQSPDIRFSKRFEFPDDTGQVGNAILRHPVGLPDVLSGDVTFQRVQAGMPVEGRFSFRSEPGGEFEGRFHAGWDDQIMMCG